MLACRRTLTLVLWLAVVLTPASAFAETASPNVPSSTDLVEEPNAWDGATIAFAGEAIGEAMVRGDHAWIHINDDAYYLENVEEGAELGGYNTGHAVWIPASLAAEITFFGDYHHEGDVVEVTGRFNAACPQHGGDMDIHADGLRVLNVGHRVYDPVEGWKWPLAFGLAVLAAGAFLLHRRLGPAGGFRST